MTTVPGPLCCAWQLRRRGFPTATTWSNGSIVKPTKIKVRNA